MDKKFVATNLIDGQTCAALAASAQSHVIWIVGSITFVLTVIAAAATYSSKETFKIHLNDCGEPWAEPVSDAAYAQTRPEAVGV